MDSFEIMTALRNLTRLHSENELPERELLRNMNLGYQTVCALLYPLFKEDLVFSLTETSQSGNYNLPKDMLLLINVYRKNASSVFKLANKLEVEKKPLLGTVNYPSDADYPFYNQMGSYLEFYPALATTDIKLEYRKRIPELLFGIGTSASDGTYITLDNYAPVRDDVLNYSWMALYKTTSGIPILQTVARITDYTAATKRATMTCPENSQSYTYALVPMLPDEFHYLIVEMTLVYLAIGGYYQKDSALMKKGVMEQIIFVLQTQGIEYSPKVEGRK